MRRKASDAWRQELGFPARHSRRPCRRASEGISIRLISRATERRVITRRSGSSFRPSAAARWRSCSEKPLRAACDNETSDHLSVVDDRNHVGCRVRIGHPVPDHPDQGNGRLYHVARQSLRVRDHEDQRRAGLPQPQLPNPSDPAAFEAPPWVSPSPKIPTRIEPGSV